MAIVTYHNKTETFTRNKRILSLIKYLNNVLYAFNAIYSY